MESGSGASRTGVPLLPAFPRDPDSLGCRTSESDRPGVGGKGQGLIVVPSRDPYSRPGADAAAFQEFQQVPVTLVDAAHNVILPRFGVGKKHQASSSATAGTLEFAQIAVWTGAAASQFGQQPGFKIGRHSMFQTLGFVVHPI